MLELRSIRAGYGRLPVLFDVDLTVEGGDWLTVVGANGSGRSTLLKTIMGVTNTTAGEVIFDGDRITHLSTFNRIGRGIALVPEGRRIFPNLSVTENLKTGGNTISRRDLNPQMDLVHELFPILGSRSRQRAGSLSGGEQQMLAIGRALMSKPKLLLVDELSLGLAPMVVAMLTEALQKLRHEGLAVVVVDEVHVHASTAAASRRLVLEKGRFVSSAAVEADRLATVP